MEPRAVRIVLGVIAAGALTSCNFYREKAQADERDLAQLNLDYASINARILSAQCTACHNPGMARGGVDLTTYESVRANLGRISEATLIRQNMPPSRPLNSEDQSMLRDWIAAGAPLGEPPTPSPSPLRPTFASIRQEIFATKCIACHTVGGAAEKVPLMDYAALLASPREIVLPGNPDESGLILAVERTDEDQMPPLSSGFTRLSEAEIAIVRAWIQSGAPEEDENP